MTTASILDGKRLAGKIHEQLAEAITSIEDQISLTVILVGNDPASSIYVEQKHKACSKIGIQSRTQRLDAGASEADLLAMIDALNEDPNTHGILVQLPLPQHMDPLKVINRIAPAKDIDGFHAENLGRLAQRYPLLRSCTPYGMMKLLEEYNIPLKGKHAVIVGASNIVGRPMALELLLAGATITVCHRFTKNLECHVNQADILIAASGKEGLIQGEWIKPGAIILDVGIHRTENGLKGDVDFDAASSKASWISPVPGGVGPMTVAMLMSNTLEAYKIQKSMSES